MSKQGIDLCSSSATTFSTSALESGTVIAVAMTSQEPRAGFPLALESHAVGLMKRSWIKISQVRTLSTDRIGKRVARASDEEVAKVVEGLNEILGD